MFRGDRAQYYEFDLDERPFGAEDDAPRMFGVDATAQQSCHAKTVNFASLDLSRYQK
jgi:hypothetical protein